MNMYDISQIKYKIFFLNNVPLDVNTYRTTVTHVKLNNKRYVILCIL